MRWHDGRFAKHPRFRYVGFNTYMRSSVNTRSTFFVKRPGQTAHRTLTVDDIRAAFNNDTPEAQALLNSIVRYSGSLRGTRPYWSSKRRGLEAMVRALGCPGTFLTFSAADNHWESLHRHLPHFDAWQAASARDKLRIAMQNLKDNPHIAAYHFDYRFKTFLQTVVLPKLQITEFWYRYEWQARGSTHVHGLYWTDSSPVVDTSSGADCEAFAEHWGQFASALNPQPERENPRGEGNPLAQRQQEPTFQLLSDIINTVQVHKCSETYCLRRRRLANGRLTESKVCRFYFPELCMMDLLSPTT
ncbi:hypothetical protein TgHK011_006624 [Trichoderma gracile]|nr:hypothetical protein TgHK011_006624 [Trichoderma gracile]